MRNVPLADNRSLAAILAEKTLGNRHPVDFLLREFSRKQVLKKPSWFARKYRSLFGKDPRQRSDAGRVGAAMREAGIGASV